MNARECLPSKEREEYVFHMRKQGCTLVTERQTNRYADELLRFCSTHSNHANAQKISVSDLLSYAKHLERTSKTFGTARSKLTIALKWCRWLSETGRIKRNPAEGLNATKLVGGKTASGRTLTE
jgi:site-specific recombinase XerC